MISGYAFAFEPLRYRGQVLRLELRSGSVEVTIAGQRAPAVVVAGADPVLFFPPPFPGDTVRITLQFGILAVDWGVFRQFAYVTDGDAGVSLSPIELVAPRPEASCSHGVYPPSRCPRDH